MIMARISSVTSRTSFVVAIVLAAAALITTASAQTLKVPPGGLALYPAPDPTVAIFRELPPGAALEEIERRVGWSRVAVGDGAYGWVPQQRPDQILIPLTTRIDVVGQLGHGQGLYAIAFGANGALALTG